MDFLLNEEQSMVRAAAREFSDKEIAPRAAQMDRDEQLDDRLMSRLAELGYFGIAIPPEYGGTFTDQLTTLLVVMELGRGCAGVATSFGASACLFGGNLAANGTTEQKERYLPAIASGDILGCLALTEPGAGSDAFSITTRARKKGDRYLLSGTKTFISNAPIADVALVYATLEPAQGKKGICLFIVEKDFPGYGVGSKFEKMGLRSSPTGEIVLDDCEVPEENLVGMIPGRGFEQMAAGLNIERVLWAGLAVGVASAAFTAALSYATEREQFNRPIVQFQLVQDMLARMSVDVSLGEQACLRAARMLDDGRDIALAAAQCKLFCSEMVMRVTTDAVQVHGGCGYMRDFPVERLMRDAKAFAIGAGTNEVQKLLIVQQLLRRAGGVPRFGS